MYIHTCAHRQTTYALKKMDVNLITYFISSNDIQGSNLPLKCITGIIPLKVSNSDQVDIYIYF